MLAALEGERLKVQSQARQSLQAQDRDRKHRVETQWHLTLAMESQGGNNDIIAFHTCLRTEWNVLQNEAFGAQRVTPDHPASVRWEASC